jgi:hypothetical protein
MESAVTRAWRVYPESGIAVYQADPWWLRWDLSPLGYLSTAAHGHLDALHLSLWFRGVALVIDPGTGAYYSDLQLRGWLSSRAAHNAPCPQGTERPRRLGPFLWAEHHPIPQFHATGPTAAVADLDLWGIRLRRRITTIDDGRGFEVEDGCSGQDGRSIPFRVRWQFAPDSSVVELAVRRFWVERAGVGITVQVGENWASANLSEGVVSPAFRKTCHAPFLELTARPGGDRPELSYTAFLAHSDT